MKCPYCNAELPDEASFCPHCARSLKERREVAIPRPYRRKIIFAALCAALVLAGIAIHSAVNRAGIYETDGAFLEYSDSDGTYQLVAAFFPGDIENQKPVKSKTVSQVVDEEGSTTVMIGVYRDGKLLEDPEEFFAKVEKCTLTAEPNENDAVRLSEPEYKTDFAPAARECDLQYDGNSGTNELYWELIMKNGDTLRLKQTFEVLPLEHLVFTADDYPMETIEDIETLIEKINAEAPDDAVVDIYLPPVTYTGDLSIVSRSFNLHGDPGGGTVLQGSLTVNSDYPYNVFLSDISFEGQGGTGLSATASVFMTSCSFSGYDIGAVALDGGMIAVHDCAFTDNTVGFKYNSVRHSSFDDVFPGNTFTGNDIGVQFARLEATICIVFDGTVFEDNRVDIDNPINYPIDTSNTTFK
ncbi:MAG: zinc ribbon domain-containing protein [Mogibacterium sp.]|nr:zinc ribbon domain-containing protein [Mogibacterium sp.]